MNMMDSPGLIFAVCLVVLWSSAQTGCYFCRRRGKLGDDERADLAIVLGATLTLLGLIIGFSFSMAVSRYNQRKDCEATEANAIGTEYARAGLLPAADAARVRELLRSYLDQRISFYTNRNEDELQRINASTAQLQTDLWSAVQARAAAQPTPIVGLAVSGMNEVLNSQGYTQAAFWNRIPIPAWALLAAIAMCCSFLVGFTAWRVEARVRRFFVLPLIVSIAFFLIADIDSARGGSIRVRPQNLESVAASVKSPQSAWFK